MTSREKFPKKCYPFSDELCLFMDQHPEFFRSLKLSNPNRFKFIPLIFTSHTPPPHARSKDEVIGMWYLDTGKIKCRQHGRVCLFKQDFVVNIGKQDKEFVSYSTNNKNGNYVCTIKEFFDRYGDDGKFYHDNKEWQHHYADVHFLPDEPRLRKCAQVLKSHIWPPSNQLPIKF